MKVPYCAEVGPHDAESRKVSVRAFVTEANLGEIGFDAFVDGLMQVALQARGTVTSGVLSGGKQSSPATEVTGGDGFMEFAANSGELVTAGSDLRDRLLVDLI